MTVNERAVSVMRNVAVVAFDELTVNDSFPFCVSSVTGAEAPFIFVLASPLASSIFSASLTGAIELLQSLRSTVMVEELPTDVELGEMYTCELSTVGVPVQEVVADATTGIVVATVGSGAMVTRGYGVGVGYE